MNTHTRILSMGMLSMLVAAACALPSSAQTQEDGTKQPPGAAKDTVDTTAELRAEQLALRDTYSEVEKLMLQMADFLHSAAKTQRANDSTNWSHCSAKTAVSHHFARRRSRKS